MRTGTAMMAHGAVGLAQAGMGVVVNSGPWWGQVVTQAAGLGLQLLFAYLNSISDQNGNKLPPVSK